MPLKTGRSSQHSKRSRLHSNRSLVSMSQDQKQIYQQKLANKNIKLLSQNDKIKPGTDSSIEDTFKPVSKKNTGGPPTPSAGGKISLNLSTVNKRQSSSRKKESARQQISTRSKKSVHTDRSSTKTDLPIAPLSKQDSLLKIEPKLKHIVSTSSKNAVLFANSK